VTKIGILGTTGMLGSTLARYLTPLVNEVVEINRSGTSTVKGNRVVTFDAVQRQPIREYLEREHFDLVVNAVGLIKQLIDEDNQEDARTAYLINSDLPRDLNAYAKDSLTPIIQIGTDCVFSGLKGNYSEDSEFDCSDLYGLSKVSGENESKSMMTIRCSIIGHEIKSAVSLMDWFLYQPASASVNGYTNHFWNGVTTLAFARVVNGIIAKNAYSPGTIHLVPKDQVSKFEVLQILAEKFGRNDIDIKEFEAEIGVNRTLATLFPHKNEQLWLNAGYTQVPSIAELIQEYAEWSS
jgi:dTDP-4-dehydrorhamnose reductase